MLSNMLRSLYIPHKLMYGGHLAIHKYRTNMSNKACGRYQALTHNGLKHFFIKFSTIIYIFTQKAGNITSRRPWFGTLCTN